MRIPRDHHRAALQLYLLWPCYTHYGSAYHGIPLSVERRGHLVRVGGRVGVRVGARVRVRLRLGARVRVGGRVGPRVKGQGARVRGFGSGGSGQGRVKG